MAVVNELAARCAGDGEFLLAARYWHGGFRLVIGDVVVAVTLVAGEPCGGDPGEGPGVIAIDTSQVGVHILSGEYDYGARLEHGAAAYRAIPGSTYTAMPGVGHFPMSEHPDRFVEHLLPVLAAISQADG